MGLCFWLGFLLWLGTATMLAGRETGITPKGLIYHLLSLTSYAGMFAILGHARWH